MTKNADHRDPDTGFLDEEHFLQRLEQVIERADRAGRWYSIVVCTPQRLPGEGVVDVVQTAAECIRALIRDEDLAGRLAEDVLAVGLPDTSPDGARVFAYRLQGDLRLCSYRLRSTIWELGHATLDEDGETWREVLFAAVDAATSRRQRIAEQALGPPLSIYMPS